MLCIKLLLLWTSFKAIGGVQVKSDEDYCKLNYEHTMCQYTTFNSMKLRCSEFEQVPIVSFGPWILDAHNSFRNKYASGEISSFTVPNELRLSWDVELAAIASRWTQQCPYYEDDFRDVERFRVATLVAIVSNSELPYQEPADIWYSWIGSSKTFHINESRTSSDGKDFLTSRFNPKEPLTLITNPYFQYMGCAAAKYLQEITTTLERRTILVCNYGPLESPYNSEQPGGRPCSNCPPETSCGKDTKINPPPYPSLCSAPVDEDSPTDTIGFSKLYSPKTVQANETDPEKSTKDTIPECSIVCSNGEKHTMCIYKEPSSEYRLVVPLQGDGEKPFIVKYHNRFRNNFARGGVTSALPLAANMRQMIWNQNLAVMANRWATQCIPKKDKCRDTFLHKGDKHPTYVSQLIDVRKWNIRDEFPLFFKVMEKWSKGIVNLTNDVISPYKKPPKDAPDYSTVAQLLWAQTYQVGCATALCNNSTGAEVITDSLIITVCNYAPGGLLEGRSVYFKGGPCTLCRKLPFSTHGGMFCSKEYRYLCSASQRNNAKFEEIATPTNGIEIGFANSDNYLFLCPICQSPAGMVQFEVIPNLLQRKTFFPLGVKGSKKLSDKRKVIVLEGQKCKHRCYNEYGSIRHVMCSGEAGKKNCKIVVIHEVDIEAILEKHNNVRENVARGPNSFDSRYYRFPKSSNMREMIWNEKLATFAYRWAIQCVRGVDLCRDLDVGPGELQTPRVNADEMPSEDLMRVNQLFGWQEWNSTVMQPSFRSIFETWIDESKYFSVSLVSSFLPPSEFDSTQSYERFSQIIWARTYLVGCSLISYSDSNDYEKNTALLVCNYAPRGNIDWHSVYRIGGPCTRCTGFFSSPKHGTTCSHRYSLLCSSCGKRSIKRNYVVVITLSLLFSLRNKFL